MKVTAAKARAAGRFSEYQGKAFYFCNDSCKEEFDANPKNFLKSNPGALSSHQDTLTLGLLWWFGGKSGGW